MNRRAHWEKIYQTRAPGELSWYEAEPVVSLDLIHATGIDQDAAIIDVGGGTSVLADRLLEEGFRNLTVLDISGSALRLAKQRLAGKASAIQWLEADVTEFEPPRTFQLWHDRAVFHFLTEKDDRNRYREVLNQSLAPGGHVIIAAFARGGPERCSGLDIVQYDADGLLAELGSGLQLANQRIECHLTPGGAEQKFAWFSLVRGSEI